MKTDRKHDAIVIGAGHAGIEAALAIARAGYQVLFMTMDKNAAGKMSCNPAIGGLAKGHMVREIDALGGEMACAIDRTGIQFRMLNRSKGPAVWAPRAQADKEEYVQYMKGVIEREPNIDFREGQAAELLVRDGRAVGIRTHSDDEFYGEAIVVTTGTFMRGLIHIGDVNYPGGRRGDPPSVGFSDSLRAHGFEVVRFKTGTPCRLRRASINFAACEVQLGDNPPHPFSFRTQAIDIKQVPCWLTFTNEKTHAIIRSSLNRSPLYAGIIKSIGPRYCPSIEDKIVKFSDKNRHQIYLEPESLHTDEIYVNGLSTSLPQDVQEEFVRTVPGLEKAEIVRFGYAIEYDCMPPTQLYHSLETKRIKNLFFSGQVNCTSGYEEAAAQGMVAGLNVIRRLKSQPPFILDRSEAYIGVLIDDLVTRGTNEPYRMFTSRAEFRLLLRQDNSDERLMKYGFEFGLVPREIYERMIERKKSVQGLIQKLDETTVQSVPLSKWLKRPEMNIRTIPRNGLKIEDYPDEILQQAEWDVKYEGYIRRQLADVSKFKRLEKRKIPQSIDYSDIRGLSREAREKFSKIRPTSIGQATRIPGVTSCDVSILMVFCEKLAMA